ncbi:hypothetical protein [Bradyrhizobium sp. JYMT SZCCT0428]|uniref:hypothetical protein n=1 Tax=Bradyrhizobium sp. JYMT SZCCT0428 TaxID=2807673 RepID=UPI001BA7FBA4|nr:hypothetical protein [Bradyrhizobium sp. JYMT SZCCT0428]MBR1153571.1 hypothetical protein [Bradyrhizobium sp. JYMT SZCCT0428]
MPMPKTDFELPNLRETGKAKRLKNLRPGLGRPKGATSRITKDLRQGLIESAVLHGSDGRGRDGLVGFCLHLAFNHPRTHGALLAKLLPLQIHGDLQHSGVVGTINIVSIPSDHFLTEADIERLREAGRETIEHEQQPTAPAETTADHLQRAGVRRVV